MKSKLNVVGIGPGHPDYILPAAMSILKDSDLLVGAKRNLNAVKNLQKETYELKNELLKAVEYIKNQMKSKKVSVLASGDTGFYSILKFMKKYFKNDVLNVVPGLSSIQYFFAKLSESWDDAKLISLHGRELEVTEDIFNLEKLTFLTDKTHSPQWIARMIVDSGLKNKMVYVGNRLSYDDEEIIIDVPEKIAGLKKEFDLAVVAVMNV